MFDEIPYLQGAGLPTLLLITIGIINAVLMTANLFRRRTPSEVGPTVGLYQMLTGMIHDVVGWDVDNKTVWKMLGDAKVTVQFRDGISPNLIIQGVPEEVAFVSVGNVVIRPVHVGGKSNYRKLLTAAANLRLVASDEQAEFEASDILRQAQGVRRAKVLR